MKHKQRYALVSNETICKGADVASNNKIGTYCIVMSGRGPSDKEVEHITKTVKEYKKGSSTIKNLCLSWIG